RSGGDAGGGSAGPADGGAARAGPPRRPDRRQCRRQPGRPDGRPAACGRPPDGGARPGLRGLSALICPGKEGVMRPTTLTGTLTVANGPRAGLEYELPELGLYVLGRGEECHPRLPNELPYKDISRRHCLLSLHPSEVWVLDLHSKDGPCVNGEMIGALSCPD